MALRAGSLSRPLLATARSALRSSAPLPRTARPPPLPASRPNIRRLSPAPPRSFEELGCTMSLLPLHRTVAAAWLRSHLALADARACCELSQGTFCQTCQDR